MSSTVILSAMIIFGPLMAMLTALFTFVTIRDVKTRKTPMIWLFNGSQLSLAAGCAGVAYLLIDGRLLYNTDGFSNLDFPYILVPLGVASIVFFLVNTVTVSLSIGIAEKVSPFVVWRANVLWGIPNYVALVPLALALAQIYVSTGITGLILMIVPLLVARQTFQVYGRLKNTYMETVKALVVALEAKDPYTRGHSERVSALAEEIGRLMKVGADDLEILKYAGVLHDIGKIGIAKYILRKPGKLSEDEYNRLRKHPETGALILQEINLLEKVIPAVFHHHEKYDGSGYVDGFKGLEIPFLARILAVADAFDAMTSPRPYRPAMSSELACQELLDCSGSQFDPQIVKVFVNSLNLNLNHSSNGQMEGQLKLDEFVATHSAVD